MSLALVRIAMAASESASTPVANPDDPAAAARAAGLRYVSDILPGIRRRRAGRSFRYVGPDGEPLRDPGELRRIKALAIPPAWTDVWICPSSRGHIQATGRDARGRKQYRYHPRWRELRDTAKYGRLRAFGEALGAVRAAIERDLARPGLDRERVLAAVVRLLDTTLIRIGNEEYARANGSFGLTTLTCEHVQVEGTALRFEFRGKSGKHHTVDIRDRRVARVVKRCQELPGQRLLQYRDAQGACQSVDSDDVNAYLRAHAGQEFTAKDFRTWAGTVLAAEALLAIGPASSETDARHNVVKAVAAVAERLGNTRAVCRKCYIHPTVIEAYLSGALFEAAGTVARQPAADHLSTAERVVLALLRDREEAS